MNMIQAIVVAIDQLKRIAEALESSNKTLAKLCLDLEVERGSRRVE